MIPSTRCKMPSIKEYMDKFDGDDCSYERLFKISKIQEKTNPIPPRYLFHGTSHQRDLLKDRRFGGRVVTSGAVTGEFPVTSFSVVPLIGAHYDVCIAFKTMNIERHNKKTFSPVYYEMKDEQVFFDERGWNVPKKKNKSTSRLFPCEREWYMNNPIEFTPEMIESILVGYVFKERARSFLKSLLGFHAGYDARNVERIIENSHVFMMTAENPYMFKIEKI